jgi:hypothetical protein
MKRIAVYIITLFLGIQGLTAQQKTLLSGDGTTLGGYASPVVKFTSIHDDLGVLVGLRGGLIINHSFAIGLGGYGLASNVNAMNPGPFGERHMEMGYGGLDIEYIINPMEIVHFSFHTLIGGGGVLFNERSWAEEYWHPYDRKTNGFFIVEPGANLDMNITTFLRASVGASYRFVSGLKSDVSTSNKLSGPSAMLSFRVGRF